MESAMKKPIYISVLVLWHSSIFGLGIYEKYTKKDKL